jgi:hypothetical protein
MELVLLDDGAGFAPEIEAQESMVGFTIALAPVRAGRSARLRACWRPRLGAVRITKAAMRVPDEDFPRAAPGRRFTDESRHTVR